MTENKELKPKSFRISDEIAEKFRTISSSIGGSQQETLAKLIEAYEFQAGKAILTDKKADIEQFEKYVSCLSRMYMAVLEDNQNITELVRSEFEALLLSKDKIIQELQERLRKSQEEEKIAKENENRIKMELVSIQTSFQKTEHEFRKKFEDMQEKLADKDNLNKALTDSCKSLKENLEECEELKQRIKELECLKNELENRYLEFQKELFLLEKSKQDEIVELKKIHIKEIEHYQNRYKELFDKLQEKDICQSELK